MHKYLLKIKKLVVKSGFTLFILRLPFRIIRYLLIKFNSYFWKHFLKECGRNVTIELGVHFENPKNVIIKNNVYIGSNTIFGTELDEGYIVLEDNIHIGKNCKFDHTGNIHVGKYTLFSENVKILSHTHGYDPRSKPLPKPLIIEDKCWFGINTIISENCNVIKTNTITATSSVITKDILEQNTIYAGIPAKKIKSY
ncbi:acyltransferase [Arcobacter sp. YIC-464]|uniref:acyltransferase n=1 Tax=Arcobacter sp. YIC-464 TaxID=3376631 RepID=UPI003C21D4B6